MTSCIATKGFTTVKGFLPCVFGVLLSLSVKSLDAATITGHLSAENGLDVYLSESEDQLGLLLGSESGSNLLFLDGDIADGVIQYLHIVVNGGSRFIASLELEDGNFVFPNGGYTLSSNTTDWIANETGVGMPGTAIVDLGPNGTDPGGYIFGVTRDARYIWTGTGSGVRYFVVPLTPNESISSHSVSIADLNGYVQESGPNPVSRSLSGEIFDTSAESDKGVISSVAKLELVDAAGNETIEGSLSFEAGDFVISGVNGEPGAPFPAVQGSLNLNMKGFIRIGVGD